LAITRMIDLLPRFRGKADERHLLDASSNSISAQTDSRTSTTIDSRNESRNSGRVDSRASTRTGSRTSLRTEPQLSTRTDSRTGARPATTSGLLNAHDEEPARVVDVHQSQMRKERIPLPRPSFDGQFRNFYRTDSANLPPGSRVSYRRSVQATNATPRSSAPLAANGNTAWSKDVRFEVEVATQVRSANLPSSRPQHPIYMEPTPSPAHSSWRNRTESSWRSRQADSPLFPARSEGLKHHSTQPPPAAAHTSWLLDNSAPGSREGTSLLESASQGSTNLPCPSKQKPSAPIEEVTSGPIRRNRSKHESVRVHFVGDAPQPSSTKSIEMKRTQGLGQCSSCSSLLSILKHDNRAKSSDNKNLRVNDCRQKLEKYHPADSQKISKRNSLICLFGTPTHNSRGIQ
jgi:hypothetical protein